MKIVVLVKEVPDTYGDRRLSLETGLTDRGGDPPAVIDEIDERALEVALSFADTHPGTEVTVLAMAPEGATANLRKALAMGAACAVHVTSESLLGADLGLTAEVLAAGLRRDGFDLVVAGVASTDGGGGMLPAMVAELLEVPNLTALTSVAIDDHGVSGTRASDDATMQVRAELPAVISVTEQLPDARFPSFKGIMAAKKKPITVVPVGELGIDPDDLTAPRAIMLSVAARPPREAGVKIVDEGDAAVRLADFLAERHLLAGGA